MTSTVATSPTCVDWVNLQWFFLSWRRLALLAADVVDETPVFPHVHHDVGLFSNFVVVVQTLDGRQGGTHVLREEVDHDGSWKGGGVLAEGVDVSGHGPGVAVAQVFEVEELCVFVQLRFAERRHESFLQGRIAGALWRISDERPHLFVLCEVQCLHDLGKFCGVFFDPSHQELVVCAVEPRLWVFRPEVTQFDGEGVDAGLVFATLRQGPRLLLGERVFSACHRFPHE